MDFSHFTNWLLTPQVQWGLLLTLVPSILATQFTKTLPVIAALTVLNMVQTVRKAPHFTNLCAKPRKVLVFLWAWGWGYLAVHELWPNDAPRPVEVSNDDWMLVLASFGPLLVMLILEVSKRMPKDSKWFGWLNAFAEWLGSGEYDPRAAQEELNAAQHPLKKMGVAFRQVARGTKKRVRLPDGSEVERDATVPSAPGEETVMDESVAQKRRGGSDVEG